METFLKYLSKYLIIINLGLIFLNGAILKAGLNGYIIPSCNITILYIGLKLQERFEEQNGKEE